MAAAHLWMRYGFLLLALLAGIGGLAAAYRYAQRRAQSRVRSRSLWDYVLLWPLLLDRKNQMNGGGRQQLLTARVVIGWLFIIILALAATIFNW
jgi:hypothetical protein